MCELLGLCFNQPIRPQLSFRGFRHRGGCNPDGWGIARFDGKACQVFKEPFAAPDSGLAEFVRDYQLLKSKVFIGHVRRATKGEHLLRYTHPFVRTFRHREVALAHNGTVQRDDLRASRPGLKFMPVGETDSEFLFCALLTELSNSKTSFTDFQAIHAILHEFNQSGEMNLLFSDGEHLYVYRDQRAYKRLCIRERRAPFGKVSLRDEDWQVNLDHEKRADQRGFLIASQPLTREKWEDLAPGSLSVFKDGDRIFPT